MSANPAHPLLELEQVAEVVAQLQHADQIIACQQQQLEAHEQTIRALRSRIRDLEQLLEERQLHGPESRADAGRDPSPEKMMDLRSS